LDDTNPYQGFTRLFDLHYPALHRYLHRRVGPVLAEDLAAQTFTEALHSHDPARADPVPWLYGIAHNLLRRHHRQERRQLRAFARSSADLVVADDTDAIAARLDAANQGPNLAAALAALNARDRDVLLLFAWAGLDYGGIASALGIPTGTVRSRLHRARRQVRARLAREPAGAPARQPNRNPAIPSEESHGRTRADHEVPRRHRRAASR
jgi:RNA polymerase sigma factor (sigma-70 family)